ncbi:LamG domain-containing protein [bacterium]|nr:LamG domain-containing protein [bacterium]
MKKMILWLFLLSFSAFSASLSMAVQEESLVLYFPFDEEKGDTANDASGNNNNGTFQGEPKWVEGKHDSALQFDGAENKNYVEIPDHPSLTPEKEITIMAWIYFDEFHNTCGVISKYVGAGNQRTYNLRMHHTDNLALSSECSSNGSFQLGVSTTEAHTPAESLKEGEWQHVAMTFKAKDFLRLYVNGEMKADSKADATESLLDNNVPLMVGTDFDPGGAHGANPREFTGVIDEVAVFKIALSDEEMQQAMENVMAVELKEKLAISWGKVKVSE